MKNCFKRIITDVNEFTLIRLESHSILYLGHEVVVCSDQQSKANAAEISNIL